MIHEKPLAERIGADLVRKNVLVRSIVDLVEHGSLHDEEALIMLVRLLAADAEQAYARLERVVLRMPPAPMVFEVPNLPASGETGTAHLTKPLSADFFRTCEQHGCRPGCPHIAPDGARGIQK